MSTVDVSSYQRADKKIATGKYTALISIGPPHCAGSADKTLLLSFPDTTPNRKPAKGLADGQDVLKVIRFCQTLTPQDKLLVHCKAGRSRSTAVALIAMRCIGMNDDSCVRSLFGRHPRSNPNGWLLKLGDAILGSRLFDSCSKVKVKW